MGALTVLLVLTGKVLFGNAGMSVMLLFSVIMNFSGYWWSDKIAIKMTGSRPLDESEAPELYATVKKLAQQAGLPMPRLYLTNSAQPNAFATGRNPKHAVIAVTEGIMRLLSKEELEGVLAHELAHVRNSDILVGSVAAMMAGTISMIANIAQWGLMFGFGNDDEDSPVGLVGSLIAIIVMPIAALLVQMAISRSREFKADKTGSDIAGRPDGLANALLKLERGSQAIPMDVNPAAAHMFIVSPLSGRSLAGLFSTHPPIIERVERLRKM
jgi:heat shock protein HtpX